MKKYFLGALVISLGIAGFAFFNIPNASAVDACNAVTVGYSKNQLPFNTYPTFTINGPGDLTIPSSRFFPENGQPLSGSSYRTVQTTSSGDPLPPGNYRIDVEPMAGTSRLVLINAGNPPTASLNCSGTSILFSLLYEPAAPAGGPSLRMNPAPSTVQVGHSVFFGAEYSTDGQNWQSWNHFPGVGTLLISSPQDLRVVGPDVALLVTDGYAHDFEKMEIRALKAGLAQITATFGGLVVSSNLTITAGPPRPPRSPSCQMWSNPQTATGGTVTLNYTVGDLPTSISIEADDAPATPPGTPTVGAPDPARADSQQTGSIVTGPITKDTVFTMTVSNSRGTQHCDVEVPFIAAPEAGLRLPLLSTLIDIPSGEIIFPGPKIGSQSINSVAYGNGVFAFSGQCGGRFEYVTRPLGPGMSFHQGGMSFFKDDGTFITERDLCMDGGSKFQSLYFHGKARSQVVADGDRGFFMSVKSNGGSVSGGYTFGAGADRAAYYQVAGGSVLFSRSSLVVGDGDGFAAANGKVVGEIEVESGRDGVKNVTLSTPSLQILAQRESGSIRSGMGFGDYIIAGVGGSSQSACRTAISPLGTPIVFRPESDGGLTSVQELTLPDDLCAGRMAIDYTTSPKRLAVTAFEKGSGSSRDYSNRIFLFTSGANGLQPAGELTVPESIISGINGMRFPSFPTFAVGGSYLVFGGRPDVDERYFTLWNNGTLVGVAQTPLHVDYRGSAGKSVGYPTYLFMTPQGKILAGYYFSAHLFDSKVVPGGGVPPIPGPGPGTGTTTPGVGVGGITDLLMLAGGYLKALQLVTGSRSISTEMFDNLQVDGLSF